MVPINASFFLFIQDELDKSLPGTSTINNNDSNKDLNHSRIELENDIPIEVIKHHQHDEFRCKATALNELENETVLTTLQNETQILTLENETPILTTLENAPVLTTLQNAPILTTLQNVPFPQEFSSSQEVIQSQLIQNHNNQNELNRDGMRTELVLETHDPLDSSLIQSNEILDVLQTRDVLPSRDVQQTRDVYQVQGLPVSPSIPIIRSIEKLITEEKANEKGKNPCVRWLRGRNELEIKCTKTKTRRANTRSLQTEKNGQRNMIQVATSTLNKLLNVIAETCEVEVSVRESLNADNAEDISFLIELRSKENSSVNVLAKVFPDQGSCLVDPKIVALLKEQGNPEISEIIKVIDAKSQKGIEDDAQESRSPEELFRMDGEEIHVDENVEQVTVNNQVSYACRLCKKLYERRDKCTVHVKTHLGIKQYLCIVCQAKFVCKSDVMKHIRCSHTNPRPISCPKCPKRFRSKFDLAEHTNVHKGIKPYRCSDCDQTYHHKVSLQMHVKSHLPPQNLACEYCGKVFPYRTRLLSHVGSVHMKNRRNFRCHFCYNLYSSLSVLNDHIKTRHATTFTCETCNKTFKVASKYKAHVHQHTNPKPYVCTVCDNRYASKAFLNEHLLKHQGLRKHVCTKCGARFAQASHLAAHRHVHGEKTHVCSECGKKFNRRDNMKVHLKRHFENDKKGGSIKQEDDKKNEK